MYLCVSNLFSLLIVNIRMLSLIFPIILGNYFLSLFFFVLIQMLKFIFTFAHFSTLTLFSFIYFIFLSMNICMYIYIYIYIYVCVCSLFFLCVLSYFVNLSCAKVGLVSVSPMCFCFAGLSFFPLASLSLSFLSFFSIFRPFLIHARMPELGRDFVPGHTFLHSWSGPLTLVVGLLHGDTFLSNLTLVLFVSFIGP